MPSAVSDTYLETRGSVSPIQVCHHSSNHMFASHFQEPRKRFTYSQNYLSAMVEPQDSEEEEKKAKKKSRQAWLTANGFQVTGLRSSTESNCHLRLLPTGITTEQTEVHRKEQGLRCGIQRYLPPNLLFPI